MELQKNIQTFKKRLGAMVLLATATGFNYRLNDIQAALGCS